MASADDSVSPRTQFIRDLIKCRKEAGLTRVALSRRMQCHASLVSHVELGRRPPTENFATSADRAFGLDGHFATLCERISTSKTYGWFAKWVEEVEPRAAILQSWDTMLVPGILQTEAYARAIFSTEPTVPPDQVEDRVRNRVHRRQIFEHPHPEPPMFLALMDEGVLHRPIGGPAVLAAQLRFLLEVAQHPRFTIQVVPIDAACPPGCATAFALARLRDGTEVVTCDSIIAGQVTTDPEIVGQLRVRYDTIRADAYTKRLTLKVIEDAIEKWTE